MRIGSLNDAGRPKNVGDLDDVFGLSDSIAASTIESVQVIFAISLTEPIQPYRHIKLSQ